MSADRPAVELAYHCLLFLVDADDPRELAAAALAAAPKLSRGMSDEVRLAVLDRFEPSWDPKPGLDFLPLPDPTGCPHRCDDSFASVDCPEHGLIGYMKGLSEHGEAVQP